MNPIFFECVTSFLTQIIKGKKNLTKSRVFTNICMLYMLFALTHFSVARWKNNKIMQMYRMSAMSTYAAYALQENGLVKGPSLSKLLFWVALFFFGCCTRAPAYAKETPTRKLRAISTRTNKMRKKTKCYRSRNTTKSITHIQRKHVISL
jgi:hypothetical protein